MTETGIIKIAIFLIVILFLVKPLGFYIKRVLCGETTLLDFIFAPVEKLIYFLLRVKPDKEQNWKEYTVSIIVFSIFSLILLFFIQRFQQLLPGNPQNFGEVPGILAFNTAVSFVTNTNWQAYSGESTMSYFSQVAGLSVQQFLSAAVGIAVAAVLIRSFARKNTDNLGNFWVDITRITVRLLLPLSFILALFFIWQGVPQNFNNYVTAQTLEGAKQIIPQGPVASFEAIKILGTNGGGFFGANSMHPYENPTPFTNIIQCICIFLIASSLVYAFGLMINSKKQGWTILIAMIILFVMLIVPMYYFEGNINPQVKKIDSSLSEDLLKNMQGKETRFGIADSVLYSALTTSTSTGAVNCNLDTLNPLAGGITIFNMSLGEVIIGGVGSGLYNMLMFVILTVFIAGLMVGRTPEFLGKKIGITEMKFVMIALLISPFCVLFFTALGCFLPSVVADLKAYGPHGFSRILYAFMSAANNNGSSFSGLNANTDFINISTAICMLLGRFVSIIAVMGVAGSIVRKKIIPPTSGTFPTTGAIFVVMLLVCILIIGGLNFFPALALGPIVEHVMMFSP
ncbi:MAG TPA: potassium-transporting ATPase subunit KdpA [Lentisphaeria bacterium]|nr:MAG: potassium-transporting ATPase subunit KdpA [Lentisphaerae bacterium GWF2_38_69]HBM14827.1 potassium-transporting ATPase subunit KdpA [Lentisphaeria bacterium]